MQSKYTVEDIANYFLSKSERSGNWSITPLKIQKLVYYAQGFYLALFKKPLFSETIEKATYKNCLEKLLKLL